MSFFYDHVNDVAANDIQALQLIVLAVFRAMD